ncbi:MAG: hypothetical protein ABIQ73_15470 [Acidimicrobiales bacterium]
MNLVIGMVVSVAQDASGATVAVATPSGPADVRIDVVPDTDGAERVRRTLRHCTVVRMTCEGGRWSSRVHGIGHYRPTDLRISVATALGLLALGLPCVVRVP